MTEHRAGTDPRQPRDVLAFGHELGRVLSDGRIVGRAEPFAKVFPSSRTVKKAVGLVAWGILEDVALDATVDERGRLVATTNTRRIADHLGLSPTTVHKHLSRLREYGFILHEEARDHGTGRFETSRYVIDPTACIERFTLSPSSHPADGTRNLHVDTGGNLAATLPAGPHTGCAQVARPPAQTPPPRGGDPNSGPARHTDARDAPGARDGGGTDAARVIERADGHGRQRGPVVSADSPTAPRSLPNRPALTGEACPSSPHADSWYTGGRSPVYQELQRGAGPMYQPAEHGDLVQKKHRHVAVEDDDQHPTSAREKLTARLRGVGVVSSVAEDLVANHPAAQIRDALDAVELHRPDNPAGWLVRAISAGWNLTADATTVRDRRVQRATERVAQPQQTARANWQRRNADRLLRWAHAVSTALDDDQLAAAVAAVTAPVAGVGRRSAGLSGTQLVAWAIATASANPDRPLPPLLAHALPRRTLPQANHPPDPRNRATTTGHAPRRHGRPHRPHPQDPPQRRRRGRRDRGQHRRSARPCPADCSSP